MAKLDNKTTDLQLCFLGFEGCILGRHLDGPTQSPPLHSAFSEAPKHTDSTANPRPSVPIV